MKICVHLFAVIYKILAGFTRFSKQIFIVNILIYLFKISLCNFVKFIYILQWKLTAEKMFPIYFVYFWKLRIFILSIQYSGTTIMLLVNPPKVVVRSNTAKWNKWISSTSSSSSNIFSGKSFSKSNLIDRPQANLRRNKRGFK